MEVIRYQDPKEFRSRILDVLVQHEAENNLILGILANIIAEEHSEYDLYQRVFQDAGQIQAIALCTPPKPVLISYENPPPGKKVIKAMVADMQETLQDDFTGLSGNREFVSCLASQWEEDTGKQAVLKLATRIYKLEEVQPVNGVPGKMRPADQGDQDLLKDWFAGFYRDAMSEEIDPDRVKKQVSIYLTSNTRIRGMMIWEINGQPVSMAGYAGPTASGIRVNAVYTPPDLRKQGYASAVTAGVSQHLLDQGYKFCFLFTDLLNPTSNHIYQQIGYRPVCDVDSYLFG